MRLLACVVGAIIALLAPALGGTTDQRRPEIYCRYGTADREALVVRLELDGEAVAAVLAGDRVSYRPDRDLALGRHCVRVEFERRGRVIYVHAWEFTVAPGPIPPAPRVEFLPPTPANGEQVTTADLRLRLAAGPTAARLQLEASLRGGAFRSWPAHAEGAGVHSALARDLAIAAPGPLTVRARVIDAHDNAGPWILRGFDWVGDDEARPRDRPRTDRASPAAPESARFPSRAQRDPAEDRIVLAPAPAPVQAGAELTLVGRVPAGTRLVVRTELEDGLVVDPLADGSFRTPPLALETGRNRIELEAEDLLTGALRDRLVLRLSRGGPGRVRAPALAEAETVVEGTAEPGALVRVDTDAGAREVRADASGRFRLVLEAGLRPRRVRYLHVPGDVPYTLRPLH